MQSVAASREVERTEALVVPPAPAVRVAAVVPAMLVTGTVVCLVALMAAGGDPQVAPAGLPDAGEPTGWALRLVRVLGDLAAILTVGSLLVGAALVRERNGGRGDLATTASAAARFGGVVAGLWALLCVSAVLLTASDAAGVPLTDLDLDRLAAATSTSSVQALIVALACSAAVAVAAGAVRSVRGCRLLVLVALAGLLQPALAGHAAAAVDHDVAAAGLVVHVVSAAVWTGGLAGLLLHLRNDRAALAHAAGRFSLLALIAFVALGVSGLLTAWTRLPSLPAWSSGYGMIVAAKLVLLVLLGVAGHLHRRRSLPALSAGRPRTLLRLAAVELVVMSAAMGLAAALTHTPVPVTASPTGSTHGPVHPSLPSAIDPVSLGELVSAWRPNALVLVGLGLALTGYARGVRSLTARGGSWPVRRSAAFAAGLLLILVDLCSGIATYAPAMASVQVAQLLVMLVPVPALLALGAPVTLWLRATCRDPDGRAAAASWSPVVRSLLTPVTGAALASGLLVVVYRTPLVELSVRSFWIHLLVLAMALAAGLVLFIAVLGVDPVPDPRGLPERTVSVLALVACLAVLAAQLRYGDRLLAGDWFRELRWGWVDPVADQRLAGGIVAAVAAGTTLALALLVLSTWLGARRAQSEGGHTVSRTRPVS